MRTVVRLVLFCVLVEGTQVHRAAAVATPGRSVSAPQYGDAMDVTGVVAQVDRKGNAIVIMAPASKEAEKKGKTVCVDKQTNLVAIRAVVDQGAPIMRDGKPVHLEDIKEGDLLRTTYDPGKPTFVRIEAISEQQIRKERGEALKELGEQTKRLNGAAQGTGVK